MPTQPQIPCPHCHTPLAPRDLLHTRDPRSGEIQTACRRCGAVAEAQEWEESLRKASSEVDSQEDSQEFQGELWH